MNRVTTHLLVLWFRAAVFAVAVLALPLFALAQTDAHVEHRTGAAADASADAPTDAPFEAADEGGGVDAEVDAGAEDAAVALAVPSASASTSAVPLPPGEGAPVRLHEKRVFLVRVAHGGTSKEDRAKKATEALGAAFEENDPNSEVHVDESQPGVAIVLVGKSPIIELGQEDADAAGVTLTVHAADVATKIRDTWTGEKTRSRVANTVFSWSLVVFTGLVAFLVLRRGGDIGRRARQWIKDNPKRLPVLRIGAVEIMKPAAFAGVIRVAIALLERALQLLLIYVWFVFVLSLFESTHDVSKKVTTVVITPLGELASRIASSLPIVVVFIIAGVVVALLVRFIGLFLDSVARGETAISWLPADLARPTSAILRTAIILIAVLFGAPLVTGSDTGLSARATMAFGAALGLAVVPLFASAVVGTIVIFRRSVRVGDFVSIDGRQGRVAKITLLEVRIHDGEGGDHRVPTLALLLRPVRILGPTPLSTFNIIVSAKAPLDKVREIIAASAKSKFGEPRIRLLGLDSRGARFEVVSRRAADEPDPATAIAIALRDADIELGSP